MNREKIKLFKSQPFYKEWLSEFKASSLNLSFYEDENDIIESVPSPYVISKSFIWKKTKKGHSHWEKINKEWLEILRSTKEL